MADGCSRWPPLGGTVEEAGVRAYTNLRQLYFQDMHYREDIASGAAAPV